jgi:mono/diheme cytochrome c family protein
MPTSPQTPKPSTKPLRISALALTFSSLAAAALYSPSPVAAKPTADPAPNTIAYYNTKVQPIFKENCYRCHGGEAHRGGFVMDTKAGLLKGGKDGAVVIPGHPEQSLLLALIRHEGPSDDPMPMPPKSKISDADIATVTTWLKAGAIMPE